MRTWLRLLLALVLTAASAPPTRAAGPTAGVQGYVTDARTGRPVAGAHVAAWDGRLRAVTNVAGQFAWQVPLAEPSVPVTLTVSAAGYGAWTITNLRLVADDTLLLTAPLEERPVITAMPALDAARPAPAELLEAWGALALDPASAPLPETIRVRVTNWPHCDLSRPYTVQVVNFREYLRHVLPNEWGAWHINSLRAGAMAVKMYAWAMIARGGKWPDADVYDSTCDQVYNPNVSYARANQAIDDTWPWRLSRNGQFFPTYYRAYYSQCLEAGLAGNCMGQWDSKAQADAGAPWDQIVLSFYSGARLTAYTGNYALRFGGTASAAVDRVRIPLDGPPRAADVGAGDFTLEWWLKADPGQNMTWTLTQTITATCGVNDGWLNGSVLFDRDVWGAGDYGDYGVALVDGRLAVGANNGLAGDTLCGQTPLADGHWHHVAVTRRRLDGWLRIYVDGRLDVEADGPDGDISYRDGRTPDPAGEADPYLVIGGRKVASDPDRRPAFSGWLDEVRVSTTLRYTDTTAAFTPTLRFTPDAATAALFHFDDALAPGRCAGPVYDAAPVAAPADGRCLADAAPAGGPDWVLNDHPAFWRDLRLPVLMLAWAPPPRLLYLPVIGRGADLSAGPPGGAPSSGRPPGPP